MKKHIGLILGLLCLSTAIIIFTWYKSSSTYNYQFNSAIAATYQNGSIVVSPCQDVTTKLTLKENSVKLSLKHAKVTALHKMDGVVVKRINKGEFICEDSNGNRFALILSNYTNPQTGVTSKLLFLIELDSPILIFSTLEDCSEIYSYLENEKQKAQNP